MNIKIMSKKDAEKFNEKGYYCVSLISLIETEMKNSIFEDVLSIRVDDITKKIKEDMIADGFDDYKQYILFNEKMKEDIINFVKVNNIDKLVVHCSMGISRSSSVACLILSELSLDYDWIIKSDLHTPNRYICGFIDNKSELMTKHINQE